MNPKVEAAASLLRHIIQSIVQFPDQVQVAKHQEGPIYVLHASFATEDLGKVIGKQGATARSIRMIMAASNKQSDMKIRIELEPGRKTEL